MRPSDHAVPGPVIAAAFAAITHATDDEAPNDAQATTALEACRDAGRHAVLRDLAAGHEWSDRATAGLAATEALGALRDLDLDPEDAPPGLLAALADAYLGAYRAH